MSGCAPKTCCTCHDVPDTRDACMCGCGYLNGAGPVIGTQMLVVIGLFFSLAALGDCSFVSLGERLFLPDDMDVDLPIIVTQTQYIGFLTWQQLDGSCYWYNSGQNPEDQVEKYFDLLGDDWNVARIIGGIGATLSFFLFCYLCSFVCSSQVRGARYFWAFFMGGVLTTLQGLTFLVFRTDLCEEKGCTFSRGAGLSVAAIVAFFLAGICFLFASDYPGDRPIKRGDEGSVNKMPSDEEATRKEEVHEEGLAVEPEDPSEEEIIEEEVFNEDVAFQDEESAVQDQSNGIVTADSRLKDAEA